MVFFAATCIHARGVQEPCLFHLGNTKRGVKICGGHSMSQQSSTSDAILVSTPPREAVTAFALLRKKCFLGTIFVLRTANPFVRAALLVADIPNSKLPQPTANIYEKRATKNFIKENINRNI